MDQSLIDQIEKHKLNCKLDIISALNKFKDATGLTVTTIGTTTKTVGNKKILISVYLEISETL